MESIDQQHSIKDLFDEDQQIHKDPDAINSLTEEERRGLVEDDGRRRGMVVDMNKRGELKTGEDYRYAAVIMQHGNTMEDFRQANELAKKALDLGDEGTKWIYAATLDRLLVSEGKPQKFGTQFKRNANGELELFPVDSQTTDEERSKYNVPPLSEALDNIKRKYP